MGKQLPECIESTTRMRQLHRLAKLWCASYTAFRCHVRLQICVHALMAARVRATDQDAPAALDFCASVGSRNWLRVEPAQRASGPNMGWAQFPFSRWSCDDRPRTPKLTTQYSRARANCVQQSAFVCVGKDTFVFCRTTLPNVYACEFVFERLLVSPADRARCGIHSCCSVVGARCASRRPRMWCQLLSDACVWFATLCTSNCHLFAMCPMCVYVRKCMQAKAVRIRVHSCLGAWAQWNVCFCSPPLSKMYVCERECPSD